MNVSADHVLRLTELEQRHAALVAALDDLETRMQNAAMKGTTPEWRSAAEFWQRAIRALLRQHREGHD